MTRPRAACKWWHSMSGARTPRPHEESLSGGCSGRGWSVGVGCPKAPLRTRGDDPGEVVYDSHNHHGTREGAPLWQSPLRIRGDGPSRNTAPVAIPACEQEA